MNVVNFHMIRLAGVQTVSGHFVLWSHSVFGTGPSQDAKHMEPQEPERVRADSEPGGGADTTEGGANEDIKENQENTETGANDSEACEHEGGATETVNTVEKEKDITEHKDEEKEKETEVNKNKESEVEEEGKESNNKKENDSCDKEGQLEEKHNEEEKRTKETEDKTKTKEDKRNTKEKKETKDDVKNKPENLGRKSGAGPSSALRAPARSSVGSRSARPSTRRDAMAKFQKEQ